MARLAASSERSRFPGPKARFVITTSREVVPLLAAEVAGTFLHRADHRRGIYEYIGLAFQQQCIALRIPRSS
jgi:hypothetical protein